MKLKTFVARGLILGIVLNYLSVLSFANTEIPNRYQTLEGEYITIDDSSEGNLEEIEIFGNIVQDPNNLEDIQSVGDLYVDKNGKPILDKQGREQYKIDILSEGGLNLINPSNITIKGCSNDAIFSEDGIDYITGDTTGYWARSIIEIELNVTANKRYVIYVDGESTGGLHDEFRFNEIMGDRTSLGRIKYFTPSEDGVVRLSLFPGRNACPFVAKNLKFMISEFPVTEFISYKQDKTTILLPCQIKKVGKVADRLYWDNEKNRYIIEKNINEEILNGSESWIYAVNYDNVTHRYGLNYSPKPLLESSIISDKYLVRNFSQLANGVVGVGYWNTMLIICNGNNESLEVFKEGLSKNNISINYVLEASQLIETEITTPIVMPTYENKTHIFAQTESGVKPTLKVTVDRLPQLAKEAIENAELNSSNNNIALARMYINMLPESLHKDQLQTRLNDVFSNEVILEKKSASANLDLYIKSENILQMSVSTNSVTFEDFSGVEDVEQLSAINISINSSLPYSLNAYLPVEIQNSDKSNTMNKSILNIKENTESIYQTFANTVDKIILKDNCISGNSLSHYIDLKLKGSISHEKDVYKTTIKFEAQQK